jgi:CheY-like chemotaxis protein
VVRGVGGTVLLAVLYVAAAKVSFALAFVHTSIAPVWLPSGLAVAAVVRFGYRAGFGVWLGALVFNALTPVPLWLALLFSLGNAAEAAASSWLLWWSGAQQARAKGLNFTARCDPQRRRGDPARLRQIVAILVANAVKATDHGGVAVRVSAEPPGVRIDVTDTGARVHRPTDTFEPFTRPDSLGLAVASRLATAMGGRLEAAGSTFSCVVPLDAARGPARTEPDPREPTAAPPGSARLLLVEDNEASQAIALDVLASHGYHVDLAANGVQALAMAGHASYAAILMDCQMPLLDGYAATAALRQRETAGRPVPIIALGEDRDRCLAAGMDDFVAKPIDFDELAATVARWVTAATAARPAPAVADSPLAG